ncbi:DUF92 domain-containing protein [Candidatus Micrarchaeota archaeon]|nr:DUF92 domain-containing protein [Candidatus Micrarchaeota archaeon]
MIEPFTYIIYASPLVVAFGALASRALTLSGVIVGLIMSYAILHYQGPFWLALLYVFFFAGMLATRFKESVKKKLKVAQKTRTYSNALANAGLATVMAYMGNFYGFMGAFAAATGDTLSSEVGMLSKRSPVMITTLRRVKTGTNGGITLLGTAASVLGGLVIGLAAYPIVPEAKTIYIAVMAGFIGSAIDSFIGATLENRNMIKNWATNFICTVGGAGTAIIFGNVLA